MSVQPALNTLSRSSGSLLSKASYQSVTVLLSVFRSAAAAEENMVWPRKMRKVEAITKVTTRGNSRCMSSAQLDQVQSRQRSTGKLLQPCADRQCAEIDRRKS